MHRLLVTLLLTLPLVAQWQPAGGRIMTRWAADVSPENAWPEHPRPQLVRPEWRNLNGLWDYAITGVGGNWTTGRVENATYDPLNNLSVTRPPSWDGRILVPFAVESALSGVGRIVKPEQTLWYRRSFEVPANWAGRRVLLNFEAVDWHTIVFLNGQRVGENKGGYVPFSIDITAMLSKTGQQEVVLAVWDPTNAGDQSVGKQALPEQRKGFRYTPTTGIWQTVWLEGVPDASIERLKVVPDVDGSRVLVTAVPRGTPSAVTAEVLVDGKVVSSGQGAAGQPVAVDISNPRLWSPDSPYLYDLRVTMADDTVGSYFGMRKIAVGKDERGVMRFYLNNELLRFQYGPLDQGYWPDGVLTPPSDAAAEFDVQYLRDIACNMIRVHIKVHPARWYYHCDRLGLLVWQDMVCTRKFEPNITPVSAKQWESEQRRMIDSLHNHPSIIQWIVFNEAWGQYDTERLTAWTKDYDPTRVVTNASGWTDFAGAGDVRDIHDYSIRASIPPLAAEPNRAIVIGEFGGFNVYLKGHLWHPEQREEPRVDLMREGGRERYADGEQWLENYRPWIESWRYLIGDHGLNAGVYTQIADVEHEPNGWLTYDREVSKIPVETLRALHEPLYGEPPGLGRELMSGGEWRHSTANAPANWNTEGFDDSSWTPAPATPVDATQIYLRRTINLDRVPLRVAVRARMRGDAEVYVNGQLIRGMNHRGPRNNDVGITIQPLAPAAMSAFRIGSNTIAVKTTIRQGPIFCDLDLVEID
jgi:glycosyl hydrolase family 2